MVDEWCGDSGGRLIPLCLIPLWDVELAAAEVRRNAASGVATHVGGWELDVPQRDETQRNEAPATVAAPLVHHSVVVRVHARLGELPIGCLEEGLPAEAGKRGKRERRLDPIQLHVGHAGLRLVTARPHLLVGDRRHGHVVPVEADGGNVALVDVDEILVDPAVRLRAVGIEALLVGPATDVAHRPDPSSFDARAPLAESLGEPGLPEVGGSTTWSSTLTIFGNSATGPPE